MANEMPKCITTIQRVARKAHKCCECENPINKGDIYLYTSGVWDMPQSYKQCVKCGETFDLAVKVAMDKLYCYDYDEGPGFGGMHEWIREFIDQYGRGAAREENLI